MKSLRSKYGLIGFIALLLVLCTLLGVLFTQARYEEETSSSSQFYESDMEYIIAEQVEVTNVEELIAAIENGYSNIKVADSVDNPLIITSGVTDVGTDLILDLNGHEIQRNNRDPMLNIENGVRLTIIDTSEEQGGSFYNPVGSVLQVGGGTLTVSAGAFVSGPKKSEYAHPENGGWSAGSATASADGLFTVGGEGGSIGSETASVTLYENNDAGGYTPGSDTVDMPVITPYVTQVQYSAGSTESYWFVNGNMYFDKDIGKTGYAGIKGDTYLYHVLSDKSVTGTQIAVSGSADFYYTYNVRRAYNGAGGAPTYTLTGDAADGTNVFTVTVYGYNNVKGSATGAANYATVKMLAGNMYVRGGSYAANFGTGHSYGVYASGGYMSVEAGAFDALEGGVCIECAYGEDAGEGEYLRVANGSFRSDNGDTVRVSGGEMLVSGGAFYKDDTDSDAADGAIIRVSGGTLTASGSAQNKLGFSLTGSTQYGVYADNGTVTLTNAAISFATDADGKSAGNVGVYATGGKSAVTLTDTDITVKGINGSGNYGVNAAADVSLNGNCTVQVEGSSSIGLLAQGGNITYTGEGGVLDLSLAMSAASKQIDSVAMAALNGGITLSGTVTVHSAGMGVAVWAGEQAQTGTRNSLTLESGSLTVNTTRATALYVSGGDMRFAEGTTVSVTSEAANDCFLSETDGELTAMFNGVFVQNGSLTALGGFTATHTGAGAAVCVDGGNATFEQGAKVTKNAVTDGYPKIAAYYDGVRVMNGSLEVGGEFTVRHYGVGAAVYVNKGTAQEAEGAFTAEFGGNTTIYKYGADSYVDNPVGALQDGVHIADGTMTVSGSFTVDHSGAGAAVYAKGTVTLGGTAKITRKESAYVLAGARYDSVYVAGDLTTSGTLDIDHAGIGSGIYVEGEVSLQGSLDLDKTVSNNTSFNSAVPNDSVHVENGSLEVTAGKSFTVEHSGAGAAVYAKGTVTLGGTATIIKHRFSYNSDLSGVRYDGVYVAGSLTVAENGSFGVTHTGIGAAVYVADGTLTLNGAADITNTMTDAEGVAIKPVSDTSVSYDGVYVAGSLKANGTFNVTHTGVANATDYVGYAAYKVRSYAVRVEEATNSTNGTVTIKQATNSTNGTVTIKQGTITNTVGGGVYVSGGTVTLGTQEDAASNSALNVSTSGTDLEKNANGEAEWYEDAGSGNWSYCRTTTGGHAVEVSGGTLYVESGTYSANQGNGILVSDGTANIYNGHFKGADSYKYNGDHISGAGASYSFKLYGGTVNVYNGLFDGSGSSAFVMGKNAENIATANIYGGTFKVDGQSGFSVYQHVTLTFDENGSGEEGRSGSAIEVQGNHAGIAIEEKGEGNVTVNIDGGKYSSSRTEPNTSGEKPFDAIWYGKASAKLNISGGTFTGSGRSGLFIVHDPEHDPEHDPNSNIQLSGGTFIGHSDRGYGYDFVIQLYPYYYNGAIGASCSRNGGGAWSGVGANVLVNEIIVPGYYAHCSGGYVSGETYSGSERLGESLAGANEITVNKSST